MIRYGQRGEHFTCYAPMQYLADANHWRCSACGAQTPAARLVMLARLHMARLAGAA
jgi:LSD1 subclass zinc finger protein